MDENSKRNPAEELNTVGQRLSELGSKLIALRKQRDETNKVISELENEVNPLIRRHTELISQMLGVMVAPPALQPTPPPVGSMVAVAMPQQQAGPQPIGQQPANDWIVQRKQLERRILALIDSSEEGLSPEDIAQQLSVNPRQVRECLQGINMIARQRASTAIPTPDEPEPKIDDTPVSLGPPSGEFTVIPGGTPPTE